MANSGNSDQNKSLSLGQRLTDLQSSDDEDESGSSVSSDDSSDDELELSGNNTTGD